MRGLLSMAAQRGSDYGSQDGKRRILLLISGKRKCGKDYISQLIYKRLGADMCEVLHISAPLKREFAEMNNIDYNRLLDTSAYKETYRAQMVEWGEGIRKRDTSYFCRKVVQSATFNSKPIWIIADIRRKTDLDYFDAFDNLKLRLQSSNQVRSNRGWIFTKGIDDSETEVDLDDYGDWNFVIYNNNDDETLSKDIDNICSHLCEQVNLT